MANQMGLLSSSARVAYIPFFTPRVLHLLPRLPLLFRREHLRVQCAARLSNQEILVTLDSRGLGNAIDAFRLDQ